MVEGDHRRAGAADSGPFAEVAEEIRVTKVEAVEDADNHEQAAVLRAQGVDAGHEDRWIWA
jgi:hypothetical protein